MEENGKKQVEQTKMHYDIECFYNGINVQNDSSEYKYFMQFYDFSHLMPYRTEWMVWDQP